MAVLIFFTVRALSRLLLILLPLFPNFAVVYLGKNKKGQHQLSRKAVLESRGVEPRNNNRGGGNRGPRQNDGNSSSASKMSKEEIDVIAQAIEGVSDL